MKKYTPIYKMIFGSHLYGTALPTSDTDYKEVILPDLLDLMNGVNINNSFTSTANSTTKNGVDDIDCEYIPLHNMLDGFISGQSFAIEMVFGILSQNISNKIIYDKRFIEVCEVLRDKYLTSNISALMGYISSQSIKYGVKGRRLKQIETVYDILLKASYDGYERLNDIPRELLENENIKKEYISYGVYLGVSKTLNDPCLTMLDKIYPLTIKTTEALERLRKQIKSYGHRTITSANIGGADFKALSHAIRIAYQITEILKTKNLVFPLQNSQLVIDVKMQKYTLDQTIEILENLISEIDFLQTHKILPSKEEVFDDFIEFKKRVLLEFYKNDLGALYNTQSFIV